MNKKLKLEELGRMSVEEYEAVEKLPIEVVLDQVRSGHNVGSFFRTADALRVSRIHICGITPQPPNREIHKTALGATETVAWTHWEDTTQCIKALRERGLRIVAIEQTEHSVSLPEYTCDNQPHALIFGNEVRGVDQEAIDLCDATVEIPQYGTKHSFNVSVCGGIVLWELAQQFDFQE
ncbi:MAG: RNA methyltransferase [Flavobacteriales bacterium]|nr:RNA methyltransferase [Flavobacteriales bacterium]